MSRPLALLVGSVAFLLAHVDAQAAGRVCTAADVAGSGVGAPEPRGTTVSHLYVKADGVWYEPRDVCVMIGYHQNDAVTYVGRFLLFHLFRSTGEGNRYQLGPAGIPDGTPISLGLTLPDGSKPETTMGGWRGVRAGFGETEFAVQARTTVWRFVPSAYNEAGTGGSGQMDCNKGYEDWPSTFGGFVRIESLVNGIPSPTPVRGSFFEANSTNLPFPELTTGTAGGGVTIPVEGCGDADPETQEGHFSGFFSRSLLGYLGLGDDELAGGDPFVSGLMQIRDALANGRVRSNFNVVTGSELAFDPIPGVVFPPLPSGQGPVGVTAGAEFSYSKRALVTEGRAQNLTQFRRCNAAGGAATVRDERVLCQPDPQRPRVKVSFARRPSARKLATDGVRVVCDEPFATQVALRRVPGGRLLASGEAEPTNVGGEVNVQLEFRRGALKLLARKAGSATLTVVVTDGSGSRRTIVRKLKLRR